MAKLELSQQKLNSVKKQKSTIMLYEQMYN